MSAVSGQKLSPPEAADQEEGREEDRQFGFYQDGHLAAVSAGPRAVECRLQHRIVGSGLFGGDQVGDLLRLVDLHKVAGVVEQMQLAAGEQRGEVASDPGVEGSVPGAEDDLDRAVEAAQLRDASAAGEYRAEQVVVEPPERRPGGHKLLVQLRNEPLADLRVLDEPAD